MKESSTKINKNPAFSSFKTLISGTALAQAISILTYPIIARLYSPEDFGVYALYNSFLTTIVIISSFKYELAIPLPKSKNTSKDIVIFCIILTGTISLLVLIISFIFDNLSFNIGSNPDFKKIIYIIPFGIFFTALYNILEYWNIREKNFRLISIAKFERAFLTALSQFSLFFLNIPSLVVSALLGQIFASIQLLIKFKSKNRLIINRSELSKIYKRYIKFPIYFIPGSFINTFGSEIPIFILSFFFSASIAGQYSISYRVLILPISLLSKSISDVFFSFASEKKRNNDNINDIVFKILNYQLKIIIPASIFVILNSKNLFLLVFGEKWLQAGYISSLIIIYLSTSFISSPLSIIFIIYEKQKTGFITQFYIFILQFLSLITINFQNEYLFLTVFTINSFIGYLIQIFYIFKIIKFKFNKIKHLLINGFLWGIILNISSILVILFDSKFKYEGLFLSGLFLFIYYVNIFKNLNRKTLK
tara:strand:- start:620 stop:2053 length:1434 start_codon:yes stop_codon:yes gene_type:complete